MKRLIRKLGCLFAGHSLRYVETTGFCQDIWECERCARRVETIFINQPMRVIRVIKP